MLRTAALAISLLACAALARAAGAPQPQTVFAAASLTEVVTALAKEYEGATGRQVRLSFASSSTLARQIENGAAVDVFICADEQWMRYLEEQRRVVRDSWVRPIGNQLVLIAPAASSPGRPTRQGEASSAAATEGLALIKRDFDLVAALGPRGRLAVGDPAHVPAGRYSHQALEHLGWWKAAEPRLARAENVRAALALVERGEAPLGIVYATDVRAAKGVRAIGRFALSSHDPIRYSFAIIAGKGSVAARPLLEFLTGPQALERYRAFGFVTD